MLISTHIDTYINAEGRFRIIIPVLVTNTIITKSDKVSLYFSFLRVYPTREVQINYFAFAKLLNNPAEFTSSTIHS